MWNFVDRSRLEKISKGSKIDLESIFQVKYCSFVVNTNSTGSLGTRLARMNSWFPL